MNLGTELFGWLECDGARGRSSRGGSALTTEGLEVRVLLREDLVEVGVLCPKGCNDLLELGALLPLSLEVAVDLLAEADNFVPLGLGLLGATGGGGRGGFELDYSGGGGGVLLFEEGETGG